MRHHVWVLIGPSGTGKTTIAKDLPRMRPRVSRAITCTTRSPRPHEQEGVDYRFVSDEVFDQLLASGGLVEWTSYGGNRYGLPADQFQALSDHDLVCVLDLPGVFHLRERLGAEQVRAVYLQSPAPERLAERMRARGSSEEEIARRLAMLDAEREQAKACDEVIATDAPYEEVLREVLELVDRPTFELQS